MDDPTTIIRCQTLTQISRLPVSCYERNGERCFVFGPPNQPIKTVCTYRKARVFAEGVAAGRAPEKVTRLKYQNIVYQLCNLLDKRVFPCPDCTIDQVVPRVEELLKRRITLDDWVDGHPDAWDYEAVLHDNEVIVEWCDQMTSDGETFEPLPVSLCGWGFYWKHGAIHIGQTTETIARKAAALFVSLWQRGVSASFCDKLMDGFIIFLERQEWVNPLTLVSSDDPILSRSCDGCVIEPETIINMMKLMHSKDSLGLAAPQVGINARVFVVEWGEVFINPRIMSRGPECQTREGCLSFPGEQGIMRRSSWITLYDGRHYKGLQAVIIQHELDHLNGRTIRCQDS